MLPSQRVQTLVSKSYKHQDKAVQLTTAALRYCMAFGRSCASYYSLEFLNQAQVSDRSVLETKNYFLQQKTVQEAQENIS